MRKAFTLIELLIVVAIIAILAAIAVPNFLEAQVRAKVSRTKSDMRTEDTALTAYSVDHNGFPNCHQFGIAVARDTDPAGTQILERLSTPIAYLSSALVLDPFSVKGRYSAATAQAINALAQPAGVTAASDPAAKYNSYIYQSWNSVQRYTTPPDSNSLSSRSMRSTAWLLHSCGPDGSYYNLGGVLANDGADQLPQTINFIYDPTNGTISRGSIWRTGGAAEPSAAYKAGAGLIKAIQTQK